MSDFTGLEIAGRVATPGDSDWDQARAAWNLAADSSPPRSRSSRAPASPVCTRLAEVKRKWDPDGRIVANHAVATMA